MCCIFINQNGKKCKLRKNWFFKHLYEFLKFLQLKVFGNFFHIHFQSDGNNQGLKRKNARTGTLFQNFCY